MTDYLSGKKTYIFAGLIGVISAARYLGLVDAGTADVLLGLFGAGGLAALRAGVSKTE